LGDAHVLVGKAALWFARSPYSHGLRVAVHWNDAVMTSELGDHVVLSPSIIECSGRWTTCSGGFAVIDLALLMLGEFTEPSLVLRVMEGLCLDRLREPGARQRAAADKSLGVLVPKLAEAVALMEANIEETLQTEEIARLIGISRRQLERLFKQHLGLVPSRYYLDIRLRMARKLIRETSQSLLQVALMCGFSTGSHFSTTYTSVFGVTPREERQQFLSSALSKR
jgi:AraC family transcriptional regulator, L-arginine-responsive activator